MNCKAQASRKLPGETGFRTRFSRVFFLGLLLSLLTGCAPRAADNIPTVIPTEFLPTAIALTLEASGVDTQPTMMPVNTETPTTTPEQVTLTPTAVPPSATPTAKKATSQAEATHTPAPLIPEARIQIYRYGARSLVTSPIEVYARLTSRTGKVARVELFGEDGRLLAREVKVFNQLPWHVATLAMDLDFEILAAAEAGRLVISVEDIHGRIMDLNSVDLILLSTGTTELNPASALSEAFVIQEPAPNTLIQGGKLLVSGLALPSSDQPLRVALIAEDGRVLGQRLAGVEVGPPEQYRPFYAEVPYSVSEATAVLLVVYEEGGLVSDMVHLASIELMLSP